jgi:hypothetical protein
MEILILCGRGLFYVFEQPASSWAFKLPCMRRVIELADMFLGPEAPSQNLEVVNCFKIAQNIS